MNIIYTNSNGSYRVLGDSELAHFNHNHDSLGRFAKSNGVSSSTKKQAKQYTKQLRKMDREATSLYSTTVGLQRRSDQLNRTATRLKSKGKTEKANKYSERAKKVDTYTKEHAKKTSEKYKEINKMTKRIASNNELVVNVRRDHFASYRKGANYCKEIVKKNGKLKMTDMSAGLYYNAGQGNRITVKQKSKKHNTSNYRLNRPIPTRIQYYYY